MELSKLFVGAMRFKNREIAVETIRLAIDCGFNYIDTSPGYCYKDEKENSESWVGSAVNYGDYRERAQISTKSAPGNGGLGLGGAVARNGIAVRTAAQLQETFEQSLRRLGMDSLDWYQLWTTHTQEQFAEAMKPGGWYEGVMAERGRWKHLGITSHADSDTIISFLETGKFEAITMPLNVVNTTRLKAVDYCRKKGIIVIAMNPMAGGFLAADKRLKELALRFLMALDGVHPLIGFSSPEEVKYAQWIEKTNGSYGKTSAEILEQVNKLINATEPRCTACGYCAPCPESINVGASLSYYNVYRYMGLKAARGAFLSKQWEDGLRLDRCTSCGLCETRCPNQLPVRSIIADAKNVMYDKPKK